MKISIIGTGYVGLVTGVCISDLGNTVYCVDNNSKKIDSLNNGVVPIYEPGLKELIEKNAKLNRIHFTTDLKTALDNSDMIFIAVGTPPLENGEADLSSVFNVVEEIKNIIDDSFKVIVIKSTVPVGTCKRIEDIMNEPRKNAYIVSNPEFLKEGSAIEDFNRPDRVIVGINPTLENSEGYLSAKNMINELYEPFSKNNVPIFFMDTNSSEITKYASNAMLAVRISFMNEIANLCTLANANVDDVRTGVGSDNRIGSKFLLSGIGYGGSCFPKDVKALYQTAKQFNYEFKLLKATDEVNSRQKEILIDYIMKHFNNNIAGLSFTLWGLSYKPETDDIRDAPSLSIISRILSLGGKIKAYDPIAMNNTKEIFPNIDYFDDMYEALKDSNGLIIATEWKNFKTPDFTKINELLKTKVIFDGRNIYAKEEIIKHELRYFSIGR